MRNVAKKITNIKESNKNISDSELIGKIARMVVNNTTMDLSVATAFAKSQVENYKGLDIKLD